MSGRTVLVAGSAGTDGRYACQMARLLGARAITTVSSEAKADHAMADDWINDRGDDVVAAVMGLTAGQGVDWIVDLDFAANQATSLAVIG